MSQAVAHPRRAVLFKECLNIQDKIRSELPVRQQVLNTAGFHHGFRNAEHAAFVGFRLYQALFFTEMPPDSGDERVLRARHPQRISAPGRWRDLSEHIRKRALHFICFGSSC